MMLRRHLFALALGLLAAGPTLAAEDGAAPDPAQALRVLQREHEALLAQQPALQEAAGQVATLTEQNQQLDQQVQTLQAQVDGLREEAARLRNDERQRWFITGAGVLVVGLVLGLVLPLLRGRRRRGYGGFR